MPVVYCANCAFSLIELSVVTNNMMIDSSDFCQVEDTKPSMSYNKLYNNVNKHKNKQRKMLKSVQGFLLGLVHSRLRSKLLFSIDLSVFDMACALYSHIDEFEYIKCI